MQILLVEDEPNIQQLYEKQLRLFGHDVTACPNAESAWEACQQSFYQAAFVDLGLPGMDGLELCRRIRTLPRGDLSIILVITGRDKAGDLQAALDIGADDYLTKPVSLDTLQVRLTIVERQFRNRTLRKQAEAKIQRQREFLEDVLESLTYPFYVVDPNSYTITIANSAAQQNGISQDSTCHVLRYNTTTPCCGTDQPCPVQIVKETKKPAAVEHFYHDQEGNSKHVEMHAYPIFDDDGNAAQIIEYSLDITERKNAEKELQIYREQLEDLVKQRTAELRQANQQLHQEISEHNRAEQAVRASEQQYRALAGNVANSIGIVREGKLLFVNNAFCSMLGYTKDQFLRINFIDIFRYDYKKPLMKRYAQLMQGIPVPDLQAVCLTKEGREIWTEGRSSVIEWEGKPAVLMTVRDINERKFRELEMEKEREHLHQENIALRTTIKDRYKFGEIVGKSSAMQEVYELVAHASATAANVVIYGESGTGKELIAQTIHQLSNRRKQTFVPVNCGAIPESLFESEFFGHRKGAFTGAERNKEGFFDAAHKGTLFLDEVGELNHTMQVKLLRALERGEYIPVGDNTAKHADVRIVVATNRNLAELRQKGLIREDFFYRIDVVAITVPPLRDRKGDIPLLIDHFLEHYGAGKKRLDFSGKILESLYRYNWPGNIRELQNVLQRYLVVGRLDFSGTGAAEFVEKEDIPDAEINQEHLELHEVVETFEKRYIAKMLEQHHWNRTKTAVTLGIPRRTLHRKMKKFGLN